MDIEKLCMGCMKELQYKGKCPHCGFNPDDIQKEGHYLRPYSILNGKYLVGKVLGEGGFGITYIGYDLNLEIPVAIKEFYPNGFVTRESAVTSIISMYAGTNLEAVQKWKSNFIREARTLARYSNLAGIVGVKDFFEENGTAYITMEYLAGKTLKEHAKACGGKLECADVLKCLQPVMASLAKVHESGLIHRDISPDNIMLLESGNMKLLDFGAARDYSADGEKSLSVMLKPGYAPEEQYRTKGKQGPWSDVYAMAATMYKCITGVTPPESMERMRQDDLKRPSELGIRIPMPVEEALLKGMAVYAESRFQTMSEFMNALYGQGQYSYPTAQPAQNVQPSPVTQSPVTAGTPTTTTTHDTLAPVSQIENKNTLDVEKIQALIKNYWWVAVVAVAVFLLIIMVPAAVRDKKAVDNQQESESMIKNDDKEVEESNTDSDNGSEAQEEDAVLAMRIDTAMKTGKERLKEGDYDTALVYFNEVLECGEDQNDELYSLMSDAYLGKGNIASAIDILSMGIEKTNQPALETRRDYLLSNTHIRDKKIYQEGVLRQCETYSDDGNVISCEYYNEAGIRTEWENYEYMYGQLVYEEHYYANGVVKWQRAYDERGREISYYEYNEAGNLTSRSEVNGYNDSGYPDMRTGYDANGKAQWRRDYIYDQFGNCVMDRSYNLNGSLSSWQEYEYDLDGNLIWTEGFYANGTSNGYAEWEYDAYGNMTKEGNYDANGNYSWGSKYEYEYDEFNNPMKRIKYNDDSQPVEEWEYEYEYQINAGIDY